MARIRFCNFCNTQNPADEFFCPCGASLAGVELVDDDATSFEKGPAVDSSSREDAEGKDSVNLRQADDTIRPSREAASQVAFLEGPWGCHEFRREFFVGRDEDLPNAKIFTGYLTVSGKHARIFQSAGHWFVEDVGSTNGTIVNGVRAQPRRPVMLMDGDHLRFSQGLPVVFRTGRTAP